MGDFVGVKSYRAAEGAPSAGTCTQDDIDYMYPAYSFCNRLGPDTHEKGTQAQVHVRQAKTDTSGTLDKETDRILAHLQKPLRQGRAYSEQDREHLDRFGSATQDPAP